MIKAEHDNEKGGTKVSIEGTGNEISQEFYAICKSLLQNGAEIETIEYYIGKLKEEIK